LASSFGPNPAGTWAEDTAGSDAGFGAGAGGADNSGCGAAAGTAIGIGAACAGTGAGTGAGTAATGALKAARFVAEAAVSGCAGWTTESTLALASKVVVVPTACAALDPDVSLESPPISTTNSPSFPVLTRMRCMSSEGTVFEAGTAGGGGGNVVVDVGGS